MQLTIDFQLQADVNAVTFQMNGHGFGDADAGTCELDLTADPAFPTGFDPVSCPMICSHPTSMYFTRPIGDALTVADIAHDAYSVAPPREGVVYSADGICLLRLSVSSKIWSDGSCLHSHHHMQGFSHLPAISHNLMPISDYVVPDGPGRATALTRFKMITMDGHVLDGITTTPISWTSQAGLPSALLRTVEELGVTWDRRRKVTARYRTCTRALHQEASSVDDRITAGTIR